MSKGSEQAFLWREYWNDQWSHRKVLNIILHLGTAIKTRMRHRLLDTRRATEIRMTPVAYVEEVVEPSHSAGENGKLYSPFGKQSGVP